MILKLRIEYLMVGLILSGCGSEGSGTTTRRTPITNPNPTITGDSTTRVDRALTGEVFAGNNVTFEVAMPDGFDSVCNDGSQIKWEVISSNNSVTIEDTSKCVAKVTTSATFNGSATLKATLRSTGGIISYEAPIKLKRKMLFERVVPVPATQAAWRNLGVVAYPGQNPADWMSGDDLWIYTWTNNVLFQGKLLFRHGNEEFDRKKPRFYEIDLDSIMSMSDPDGQPEDFELTADCRIAPGRPAFLMTECLFKFDSINFTDKKVKMTFKGAIDNTLTDNYRGYFAVENVFKFGAHGVRLPIDIVIRAKHKNSNEVTEAIFARMNLRLHQEN